MLKCFSQYLHTSVSIFNCLFMYLRWQRLYQKERWQYRTARWSIFKLNWCRCSIPWNTKHSNKAATRKICEAQLLMFVHSYQGRIHSLNNVNFSTCCDLSRFYCQIIMRSSYLYCSQPYRYFVPKDHDFSTHLSRILVFSNQGLSINIPFNVVNVSYSNLQNQKNIEPLLIITIQNK